MTAGLPRFWSVPEVSDPDVLRDVRLLFGVARPQIVVYAASAVLLAFPGVTGPAASRASVVLLLASAAIQAGALVLAHRGALAAACHLVAATTVGTAMVAVSLIGGLRSTLAATVILAVLVAGVLRGWRSAAFWAVIAAAYAVLEHLLERAGVAPLVQPAILPGAALVSTLAMLALGVALLALYSRELERADAARTATEHELAEVFRTAPDGILVTDVEARVTSLNEAVTRIFGWKEAEVLGMRVTEVPGLVDGPALDRIVDAFSRAAGGEHIALELEARRRDGTPVWVETRGRLVQRPDGGVAFQVVIRDVSERVSAERERQRLEQELLDARRMEGLGRLAGGVAHDFRNLLTPIILNARTLAAGPADDAADLVAEIELAAQRANALTAQLLAFARRQHLEPVLLELGEVVRALEPIMRRVVREDVRFELRLAEGLPPVRADRSQLEQVIVNLVANACDAMPSGGELVLSTALADAAPARGGPPAPHVALVVSDTGHGMSEEVRARVFDPFFTTKERGRGVGLGLATVHGIVTQSGGLVQVESAPGRGSTFRVLLPAAAGAADAAAPAPAAAHDLPAGARVLVVDDAPLVRAAIARTLRARGLEVEEAEDGRAALETVRALSGRLDLLVTDVVMPGLPGPALASELRRGQPGLPVLFISGYATPGIVASEGLPPDAELLTKPFTPEQLLARVGEVLRRPPAMLGSPGR